MIKTAHILPFIDRFVNDKMKEDPFLHRRARFMVIYNIIGGTASIVMGIYNLIVKGLDPNTLVLLGPIIFSTGIIIWMKKNGALAIPTFLICFFVWMASVTSAWRTGGVYSMDLHPLLLVPMIGYIFQGKKGGLSWIAVILLTFTTLGLINYFGSYNFKGDIEKLTNEAYYMKRLMFTINIVTLIIFYEFSMKKQTKDLVEQTEENEVNRKVAKVRQQIAKDFHDEMGNKLAAITLNSNILTHTLDSPSEHAQQILNKIEKNSKVLYQSSRDFIWSIDSKSDDLAEIFAYLKDFGEDFYQSLNIKFYTHTTPDLLPELKLDAYFGRQIIMLFKEAMTNAAKYAEASRVDFTVELVENTLSISVKDDGKGFDEERVKLGKGLNNMKHRAGEINGQLEISSTPETGTQIKLNLNL